jgi:hypothetical protein
MKTIIALLILAIATCTVTAADNAISTDWTGKIVAIKTSSGGGFGIQIKNFIPVIGHPDKAAPDAGFFKIVPGTAPGTFAFESVANPGMYLRHGNFHILLHKDIIDESSYRIVAPLRGNQGVSLQSYNFPRHYITLIDKNHLDIVEDGKDLRKAVFFLEERNK